MLRLRLIISVAFVISFPSIATAALMEADFLSTGDALLTRDTDTSLEWLDLTETKNWSRSVVEGGRDGLVTVHGFRYATVSEVTGLFANGGVVDFGNSFGYPNLAAVQYLQSLLGITGDKAIYEDLSLWAGTKGPISMGMVELDDPITFYSAVATLQIMDGFPGGRVIVDEFRQRSNVARSGVASFLVRDIQVVPVPAAVWLFVSALTGLGWMRRKQTL